jgi:hypothetical protein
MVDERTYETLQSLFKIPNYYPMKFVCRACETAVQYEDISCPECDKILIWYEGRIQQRDNKVSFVIKV